MESVDEIGQIEYGPEDGDAVNNVTSHTLVEQQLEDGSKHNFYCMECCVDYENIEEFVKSHQKIDNDFIEENIEECTEVCQWEVIDDDNTKYEVVVSNNLQDKTTDVENLSERDTETSSHDYIQKDHEEDNSVIKVEDDIGDNKYYCYDCRTVFRDLQIAEEHDCPGIGNSLEEDIPSKKDPQHLSDQGGDDIVEYMCAYCENKFMELSALERHQVWCNNHEMIVPEEPATFSCSICGKVFRTIKALNGHNRMHKTRSTQDIELGGKKRKSFICQTCNTEFANSKSLKLHLRIHQERPIRRIQEALPKAAALKYDRLKHFFCEICNKSFDQDLLAIHKNMHQNAEEFICQICNRQFKNMENFNMHQQLHFTDSGMKKSIISTGPTEAAKRNSKNGIKSMHVANAKKTFPCQYCGHLFWRPHEKVRHEYVHTGEKPYPCEVCGKRFRVPYSLTLHLRTHTNIRPYVCAHCNKRFKSHSVYTHHMRTHTNERAYKCDICEKSFRTTVQLYSHKNSHTKPFNCTICNRPFASFFAVKTHMKSHLKNKTSESFKYRCDTCGAGYGALRALRAHRKEAHSIESNELLDASYEQQNEEMLCENDEQYETDTAAMMLLSVTTDASDKDQEEISNFDNNESLEHFYINDSSVSNDVI